MAKRILIGEGSGQLVIDKNAEFELFHETNYVEQSAQADSVSAFLTIRGSVVASTPAAIITRIKEIEAWFTSAQKIGPQRVQIEVDGTNQWDFKTNECINSPLLLTFRILPHPGAGVSHQRFELQIKVRKFGRQDNETNEDVYDFTSSLAVTSREAKEIRKEWRAAARAETSGQALAAVRGFKPGGKGINSRVEQFFEEARATAYYVWELENERSIEEEIRIVGFGTMDDYIVQPRLGKSASDRPEPYLHQKPKDAKRIFVRGTIWAPDPAILVPKAHYTESPTLRRLRGPEEFSYPVPITESDGGGWKLNFEERYICTSSTVPPPNHSDHVNGVLKSAPADGRVAN